MFEQIGCDCTGCCLESLPPPAAPPRPPSSPNPPGPPDEPAAPPTFLGTGIVNMCGTIIGNVTLAAVNTTYILNCPVFVVNGATMHIEPGVTLIPSTEVESPTNATFDQIDLNKDGVSVAELLLYLERRGEERSKVETLFRSLDTNADCVIDVLEWSSGLEGTSPKLNASSLRTWPVLIVERGGQIFARGTKSSPITMGYNLTSGTGLWGGLLIMGGAPTLTGPCLSDCGHAVQYQYGGNNTADSSGVLEYLRVRNSFHGIALFGVGANTVIDSCEVAYTSSDGFSLHGGTVNVARISSLFSAHAAMRMTRGYNGHAQYIFSMLGLNGTDGIVVEPNPVSTCSTYNSTPYVYGPQVLSVTIIGGGKSGKVGSLIRLGKGAKASIDSAILLYGSFVGLSACDSTNLTRPSFAACANRSDISTHGCIGPGVFIFDVPIPVSDQCASPGDPVANFSQNNPGIAYVKSRCLDSACLLRSFLDPMPLSTGRACASSPSQEAFLSSPLFADFECIGAFGSSHPQANWLAGWTLLFTKPLGSSILTALPMIFSLGTQKLQFTIDTSSLALSPLDTLPSRRRRMTTSSPNAIYSPSQCVSTGFSGVGNPIWLRLVVSEATILWLSTCTPPPAVGFDTDLAVFQVAENAELERLDQLEQLACNGDGVGEEGCQPLYSRLVFSAEADRDYFVAIGGYDSRFGANLTLTAEYATPPSPPTPPQPPSPPPPLVEVSSLQSDILAASSVSPFVITLDGVNSINATIIVPAPKQVVLRGANSSEPAILTGQGVRLFEVEAGAELYLSNLVLRNGFADGQCGGAAYVAGSGVLVAQFVRFENNSALRGGAVCMESNGVLNLTVVNMSSNRASSEAGNDIHLGRPSINYPQVNLLGVLLGNSSSLQSTSSAGFGRRLAEQGTSISVEGVWTTSSCVGATSCLFSVGQSSSIPIYSSCAPSTFGGSSTADAYGRTCTCLAETGLPGWASPEQRAVAPYGESSVESVLGNPSSACRPELQLELPAEYTSYEYSVELRKDSTSLQEEVVRIAVLLNLRASYLWQDQVFSWNVTSQTPAGVFSAMSCLSGEGINASENSLEADRCIVQFDGTFFITDRNATGELLIGTPVRVQNASGTSISTVLNGGSVLNLPLSISSEKLRETAKGTPYTQTLAAVVTQRSRHSPRLLKINVGIIAAVDAAKCTYFDVAAGVDRTLGENQSYRMLPVLVGRTESFFFTLRDVDGLPIVRETYQGVQRVELLSVLLYRLADNTSKPLDVPTAFVGSQDRSLSETNGRVRADVLLDYAGEHLIKLFALADPQSTSPAEFSWTVLVTGECLPDQIQIAGDKCGCRPGWYRLADDPECSVCPAEAIKEEAGDQACTPCIDELQDPYRTTTLGSVAGYHDNLTDCGCAAGWYLNVNSISPREVSTLCPQSYETNSWTVRQELQEFRQPCCTFVPELNTSRCSNSSEFECAERVCKELVFGPLLLSAKRSSSSSSCKKCDAESMACNQTHIAIERLHIQPGFWRVNELSVDLRKCKGDACIGSLAASTRASISEDLCATGHSGPLCAVCLPQYYESSRGSCLPCSSSTAASLYLDQPEVVHTTIIVVVVVLLCIATGLGRCVYKRRNQTTGLTGMIRWAILYGMSNQEVFASKLAILASMLQVQLAVIPAFEIIYPSDFEQSLNDVSFWEFNLPLNCVFDFDYYSRLFYLTLIPLIVASGLGILAMMGRIASDKDLQLVLFIRQPEDQLQRFVRLKQMARIVLMFSFPLVFTPQGLWGVCAAFEIRKYVTLAQSTAGATRAKNSLIEPSTSVRGEDSESPQQLIAGMQARMQIPRAFKRLVKVMRRCAMAALFFAIALFVVSIYGQLEANLGFFALDGIIAIGGAACVVHSFVLALGAHVVLGHIQLSQRRRTIARTSQSSSRWGHMIMQLNLQALFLLLFFLYPELSSLIFSAFSCERFDDGSRFLKRDLSINCDSEEHIFWQLYAIAMVCIYPIGVPCLYAAMLWLYHRQLSRVRRVQELLATRSRDSAVRDPHELGLDLKSKKIPLSARPGAGQSNAAEKAVQDGQSDRLELSEELEATAVVLYLRDGTDGGDQFECLGLYHRKGTWAGMPAFRNAEHPDLWLVSCVYKGHFHWIVQRTEQRGSSKGLVSVPKASALHESARWKRFDKEVWSNWSALSARLVDRSELALWDTPGILLYVVNGSDGGLEEQRLGLYVRQGTFASRPAFRHCEDPGLWLCSCDAAQSWLVQGWHQRGTDEGYLCVAAARSPLESVRWKRSVLIKLKESKDVQGFHAFDHRWENWHELRCRAIDFKHLRLLRSLTESRVLVDALRSSEVQLSIALEENERVPFTSQASSQSVIRHAIAPEQELSPRSSTTVPTAAVGSNRGLVSAASALSEGARSEGVPTATARTKSHMNLDGQSSWQGSNSGVEESRNVRFVEDEILLQQQAIAFKEMLAERGVRSLRESDEDPVPVTTPSLRKRAHRIFKLWHQRLGVELDPNSSAAIIRTVWPVFFFQTELSEAEEARGFFEFQSHRKRVLQTKLAMGEHISARDVLFLQAMSEADVLGSSKGLSTPSASSWGLWEFGGDRWDWSSPGQAEWESLPMEERRMWVPESRREVPEPGDVLVLIDGQPVPRGELGDMGEQYDHTFAYSLLENAGVNDQDLYLDDEDEDQVHAKYSSENDGENMATMLRNLLKLWTKTIVAPSSSGSDETEVAASTFQLNIVINDFIRTAPLAVQMATLGTCEPSDATSSLRSRLSRKFPGSPGVDVYSDQESSDDTDSDSSTLDDESDDDHMMEMLAVDDEPPELKPSNSDLANLEALVAEWEAAADNEDWLPQLEPTNSDLRDLEGFVAEFEAHQEASRCEQATLGDEASPASAPTLNPTASDLAALDSLVEEHDLGTHEASHHGLDTSLATSGHALWQVAREFFLGLGKEDKAKGSKGETQGPNEPNLAESASSNSTLAVPSPPPSPPVRSWWQRHRRAEQRRENIPESSSGIGIGEVTVAIDERGSVPSPPSSLLQNPRASSVRRTIASRASGFLSSIREDTAPSNGASVEVGCVLRVDSEATVRVRLSVSAMSPAQPIDDDAGYDETDEEDRDAEVIDEDDLDVFLVREKAAKRLLLLLDLDRVAPKKGLTIPRAGLWSKVASTLRTADIQDSLNLMSTRELRDVTQIIVAEFSKDGELDSPSTSVDLLMTLSKSSSVSSKKLLLILLLAPSIRSAAFMRSLKETRSSQRLSDSSPDITMELSQCWAACRPLTTLVRTDATLQQGGVPPREFIQRVIAAATPSVLIRSKLKPVAKAYLRRANLSWQDIAPAAYVYAAERISWYAALAEPEDNLLSQVVARSPHKMLFVQLSSRLRHFVRSVQPAWQEKMSNMGTHADVTVFRPMEAMATDAALQLVEQELARICARMLDPLGLQWEDVATVPLLTNLELSEWREAIRFAERSGAQVTYDSLVARIRSQPAAAAAWGPLRQLVSEKLRTIGSELPRRIISKVASTADLQQFDEYAFDDAIDACISMLTPAEGENIQSTPVTPLEGDNHSTTARVGGDGTTSGEAPESGASRTRSTNQTSRRRGNVTLRRASSIVSCQQGCQDTRTVSRDREGTARSGTPRSGTPRSGTPRSGTPRSGTPRSDTPCSNTRRASALSSFLRQGSLPRRGSVPPAHGSRRNMSHRRASPGATITEDRRVSELDSVHNRAKLKLAAYLHQLERRAAASYLAAYQAVSDAHERNSAAFSGRERSSEAKSAQLAEGVLTVKLSADAAAAYHSYREVVYIRKKLGLPAPSRDEITLLLKDAKTGEAKIVKLCKGRAVLRGRTLQPFMPSFVRLLTDPYDLRFMWSELIECLRKITFAGIFMLLGQGSSLQLTMGLIISVFFVVLYNNLKVYDHWQNDVLQQFCQLVVFLTLLGVFILRIVELALDANEETYILVIGNGLIGLVVFAAALAALLIKLQLSDTSVRGFFLATVKRRQEARNRKKYIRTVLHQLDQAFNRDPDLAKHLAQLASTSTLNPETTEVHEHVPWRASILKRLEAASLAELEAASTDAKKFALQQGCNGLSQPSLINAKLSIIDTLLGTHSVVTSAKVDEPTTRPELTARIVRHVQEALRSESSSELPSLVSHWAAQQGTSHLNPQSDETFTELISMLVSTLKALSLEDLRQASRKPIVFFRKLLEENQGTQMPLEMQLLKVRWRMQHSLASRGVLWSDVENFLRGVEHETLQELVTLEPASFWPRLHEVLDDKIRSPLLQQVEHKLRMNDDPEYSRILASLNTPTLEEIYQASLSKSRPFLERLVHTSLPEAARRKLVLLALRPQLIAVVTKLTRKSNEWLLDELEPFATMDDLLAAHTQPLHFLYSMSLSWLRHKYEGSVLAAHSLKWHDLAPFFGKPESIVKGVCDDADAFIESFIPRAKKMQHKRLTSRSEDTTVQRLRELLEARLTALGLDWHKDISSVLHEKVAEGKLPSRLDEKGILLLILQKHISLSLDITGAPLQDVVSVLDEECNVQQLAVAVLDTETFLMESLSGDGAVARVLLRFRAFTLLKPLVRSSAHGATVGHALSKVLDAQGLRAVIENPERFVDNLEPKDTANEKLKRLLEPHLGVGWELSSPAILQEVIDNRELDELDPVAAERKLLLRLLRTQLQRALSIDDMPLEDIMEMLAQECTTQQIADAVLNTEAFVADSLAGDGEVAKGFLRFRAYTQLLPIVRSKTQGELIGSALNKVTDAAALREIIADPRRFVEGLNDEDSATRTLKKTLLPRLINLGIDWESEILPSVHELVAEGALDDNFQPLTPLPAGFNVEQIVLLRVLRSRLSRTLNMPVCNDLEKVVASFLQGSPRHIAEAVSDTDAFVDMVLSTDVSSEYRHVAQVLFEVVTLEQERIEKMHSSQLVRFPSESYSGGHGQHAFLKSALEGSMGARPPAVSHVQPHVQPLLTDLGLEWDSEILPALDQLAAEGKLRDDLNPEDAARMVLIQLLRPQLSRTLSVNGPPLEHSLQIISLKCTLTQLVDAIFDVESFVDSALEADDSVSSAIAAALKLPVEASRRRARMLRSTSSSPQSPTVATPHRSTQTETVRSAHQIQEEHSSEGSLRWQSC